jgi:hypothetical protein
MRIPLAQGIVLSAYETDPKTGVDTTKSNRGSGWAYAAGLLPAMAQCDSGAAATVRANMDPSAGSPVKDGYGAVWDAVQKVHTCLGVTCGQMGGLMKGAVPVIQHCNDDGTATNSSGYNATGTGLPPSTGEKSSTGATAGKIIGGIIAFAFLVALVVGLYCIFCRRRKNIDAPLMPAMDEVDSTFTVNR